MELTTMPEAFTPEPTHYALSFDDLPAKGLEITVRAGTVRERLAFDRQRFATPADIDAVLALDEGVLRTFAGRIVDWNLKEEPSYDALLDLDDPLMKQIIGAWVTVLTVQPGDLGKDSTTGPDPMEASLPMEGF